DAGAAVIGLHPKIHVLEAGFVVNPVGGPAIMRGHRGHILSKSGPEGLAELGSFSFAIHGWLALRGWCSGTAHRRGRSRVRRGRVQCGGAASRAPGRRYTP
nr:hypothetical protein [Tanacetum cinerariifolium]